MTEIPFLLKKYKKEKWLFGQFIPTDKKRKFKIMFIGEKPSEYFFNHPEKRCLGNYNATPIDKYFQKQLNRIGFGQIYITDMVKTEGAAGADFESEWGKNEKFKKCLLDELNKVKPRIIIFISKRAEKLFNSNIKKYSKNQKYRISHISYLFRWRNKKLKNGKTVLQIWTKTAKEILKKEFLKKRENM